MKATINNCHDEQILKELCSIFERGLIQKEIILSVDDAQNEEEAYNVICTKYGISHKTADFIFHTTFNHWFSLNYDKVKSAYDSIARETLGRNSFHNGINMDYYIPLLKTFCQKTMSIYDKGYDQGPFIPYTMTNYSNAPIKIMYVGRDTYYWEPAETLKKAFRNNKLEDYLIANTKCVDVDKMLTWKNNTGSFWNFVNKLHLMIRTGQMVSDITTIDDKQKSILEEIGYGNLYSIEMLSTLRKRFEESELPITSEYETICKAAKPFETLKSMIEAYHPDYVFVLSWIEKNDFFEGTDFVWQKDLYQDADKKYRAVYLSNQYGTKVIWTLHPNAMWRHGLSKNDTQELIEFLANTYRMFESKTNETKMGKYVNYNELLDTLFKQWKKSYNKDVRDKFCLDGIVYKNDSSIDVDSLWGQSSRRVAFLLKDCPDGYGYDTRELLLDKIGIEKAYKNRELKVKFMKNLAKLLYGLLEMKSDYVLNDKDVDNRMPKVIDCWNSKPFVFIESKKLAGGKTVNERAIEDALLLDEVFLKKELDILSPNIIVCCNATGDSIFNFITQKYFKGKKYFSIGGDYIVNEKVVPDMKTCLWYYPQDNVVVIKAFHPSVAANWKVLEKVFSPFRDYITNVNPAF